MIELGEVLYKQHNTREIHDKIYDTRRNMKDKPHQKIIWTGIYNGGYQRLFQQMNEHLSKYIREVLK